MISWSTRLRLAVVALLLSCLSACGPKTTGEYRVVNTRVGPVILPPPYANVPSRSRVRIRFPAPATRGRTRGCSISTGMFSLRFASQPSPHWVAMLPSFEAWQAASSREHLQRLLDQIDRLHEQGCLSSVKGPRLTEAARESVPELFSRSLYNLYGIGSVRGFVDLQPGMRLKIQRDNTGPSGRFLGMSTIYYRVAGAGNGLLKFESIRGQAASGTKDSSLRDRMLPREAGEMPYQRLLLLGMVVPRNFNYPAFVIGTGSRRQMEAVTRALDNATGAGCPANFPPQELRCVAFQGAVTVSVQFEVVANRRRMFVEPGDDLESLLQTLHQHACLKSIKDLQVARKFLDRYVSVGFGPSDRSILKLPLFPSDRISCVP